MNPKIFAPFASLLVASAVTVLPMRAAPDLIVSANDAKLVRAAGVDSYPDNPGSDTLTVLDASRFPPKVVATVAIATSIAGPPQAVAITPDGKLAVVSATNRYDYREKKVILETFLQIVDLEATPPRMVGRVKVGSHPQGLAINREGTLLLAATVGGTVAVLTIQDKTLVLRQQLKLTDRRLAGISFTHDGKSALVALREDSGVMVLNIDGQKVSTARERVASGVAPYGIDISSDGRWAVVGNAGLAGLAPDFARQVGDADTVTLVDVSRRPFRAVQHLTVPSVPEGVAISPDGRWVVVQAMDGSNLTSDNPGRHARGRLLLFEIKHGQAIQSDEAPAGESGQGVVFTADSRYVLAQFFAERQIAVFEVVGGRLRDTTTRIPVSGGPVSIRSMPR